MADATKETVRYAIVYLKSPVNDEFFVYKPINIIEIELDETRGKARDYLGNEYSLINSSADVIPNESMVVGEAIEKNELKKMFPKLTIKKALRELFESARKNLNFSIYDYESDNFKYLSIPFEKFAEEFEISKEEADFLKLKSEEIEVCVDDESYLFSDELFVDADSIKGLLKLDSVEAIHNQVKNIIGIIENYEEKVNGTCDCYEEDDEVLTVEEALPIDKTDSQQLLGFDINYVEAQMLSQIVNQDHVIEKVLTAVAMDPFAKRAFDRERILLCGGTGTGKTQIAVSLCELIGKPYVIVPTTQVTAAGYVGADIEDFFRRLIVKAKGDVELAQKGVMIFEEIDKKASEGGRNNDASFRAVLNALLLVLEDNEYEFSEMKGQHNGRSYTFRTGGLTIIASGSFEHIVKNKKLSKPIGFETAPRNEGKYIPEVIIDDFVQGGVPEEFMGRFPIIAWTNPHTKESLKEILSESTISPLLGEEHKLSMIGIELLWDEKFLDTCSEAALKLNKGARSLKSIVEKALGNAKAEALRNLGVYKGIHLGEDSIDNPENASMIYENGEFRALKEIIEKRPKVKRYHQ